MPKRRRETSTERLQRKLIKYQERLDTKRRRIESSSSPPSREKSPLLLTPPLPFFSPAASIINLDDNNICNATGDNSAENDKKDDDEIDEEILAILGNAPMENKYGPPINKHIASRWEDAIKNGLEKEKRNELLKKYLPPENCKIMEPPKLNLEAQAAVPEAAVKRDKAIVHKQRQITAALTAVGTVLSDLIKNKENKNFINILNDAGRLLCDYHHQESAMRKKFIMSNFEASTRDSIKDIQPDQWLFGENFAEKLKATKAIKKSGEEIKNKKSQPKPLNQKGPTNSQFRGRTNRVGPQQNFSYPKRSAPVLQPRVPPQTRYRPPLKPLNNRN